MEAPIEVVEVKPSSDLKTLIEEAATAASEGDTAWGEFVDELEPEELLLLNKEQDQVRKEMQRRGFRVELRQP